MLKKLKIILERVWRRLNGRCVCLSCKRKGGAKANNGLSRKYWFCSFTCAILDGCMTVKSGYEKRKPRIIPYAEPLKEVFTHKGSFD